MKLLAQAETKLGPIGGEGFGEINKTGTFANPLATVSNIISAIIGFLTIVAAAWFFIQIVIAGITWISAAGEKTKLNEARDRLTNAFIGLLIVVAGWAILALAGQFFGWTDITRPENVLQLIKFKE